MNLHDQIAKVAYELYEKSGKVEGKDAENWFEAEKIIKARQAREEQTTRAENVERAAETKGPLVEVVVKESKEGLKTMEKGLRKNKPN